MCVLEHGGHAEALEQVRDQLPDLKHHWLIEGADPERSLTALAASGADVSADELDRRRAGLSPDPSRR